MVQFVAQKIALCCPSSREQGLILNGLGEVLLLLLVFMWVTAWRPILGVSSIVSLTTIKRLLMTNELNYAFFSIASDLLFSDAAPPLQ